MRLVWIVLFACGSSSSTPDAAAIDARGADALGGTGTTCGGFANVQCNATHYCDFRDNGCGGNDETGICMPRPTECAPGPDVCGCDRVIYQGECAAATAGVDLADEGFCTPPGGDFVCGHSFCDPTTQYCQDTLDDTGGANTYVCIDLPAACAGGTGCDCLAGEACGTQCAATGTGFTLICPGG